MTVKANTIRTRTRKYRFQRSFQSCNPKNRRLSTKPKNHFHCITIALESETTSQYQLHLHLHLCLHLHTVALKVKGNRSKSNSRSKIEINPQCLPRVFTAQYNHGDSSSSHRGFQVQVQRNRRYIYITIKYHINSNYNSYMSQ
jgi:hypothetical protein